MVSGVVSVLSKLVNFYTLEAGELAIILNEVLWSLR